MRVCHYPHMATKQKVRQRSPTLPLRLPWEIMERLDAIVSERNGAPSRNSVVREMILDGLNRHDERRRKRANG